VTWWALSALRRRGSRWPTWGRTCDVLALSCVGVALCLICTSAQSSIRSAGLVPGLAQQRASASVEAVVTSDPRIISTIAGGRPMQLVLVEISVDQVVGRGLRSGADTPVLVFGDLSWRAVQWHERVRATGRFDVAQPGDDVVAVFNSSRAPTRISAPGRVASAAETVRDGLRAAVERVPADARGLLPALVIGDTSRTPEDLTEAMRATSLTHLSAVSGSNVSFVLAAALGLCRLARVPRRWRPAVALACLAAFVVLARPQPSVLRAAVMGVIGLAGLSASRRRAGIPALAAAILLLLCADPWLARSYGFALSTLATLGLLLFARSWGERIRQQLPAPMGWLGPAVAIPLAAQVMCGPVIVLLQGSVSLIGVAANLAAAPFVPPATVLGVAVALLAMLSATLAGWLAWAAGVPTLGIAYVARAAAAVPMGSLPWPGGAVGALGLAFVTVGLLLGGRRLMVAVRSRPLAVFCLATLVLAAAWPTTRFVWPPEGWRLVACDVGQGDGLVLATAPRHAVVVDSGPDPALIDACLSRLGILVVDALVLTHYHADHVHGVPGVLHRRRVTQILVSPLRDPPWQATEVDRWAGAAGVPVRPLYAGDRLRWGPISAAVLWPARIIHEGSMPNNASVVLDVDDGGLRVLMLGDVETSAAHEVLLALRREHGDRGFDVLKVAHHGSALQDPGLIAEVRAPVSLISVGAGNPYGHPSQTALGLLRAAGTSVFRTDLKGDVSVSRGAGGAPLVSTRGR
jgi:competence protein ComEC